MPTNAPRADCSGSAPDLRHVGEAVERQHEAFGFVERHRMCNTNLKEQIKMPWVESFPQTIRDDQGERYVNLKDLVIWIQMIIPTAQFGRDDDGQIVISTGLKEHENGAVVEINDDWVEWDDDDTEW